jgi:drug/metabolite transporter (DMT)-like permease
MHSKTTQGYLICLSGTVLWSTTGVLIRYLTETFQLPPLVLSFWRDLSASLAVFLALSLLARVAFRQVKVNLSFFLVYGLVLAVFNSLWTTSVDLNGAAVATVLAYGSTAFTALLGRLIFKESLGIVKASAVVLSLAGCALVSGALDPAAWQGNPLGIGVGLISGLLFAVYSLMGKASSNRGVNPWAALMASFGFAAGFLLIFNLGEALIRGNAALPRLFWLNDSALGWGVLIFLGIGPTIGGFGLYMLSLTTLPASVANLIATLEPAMTAGLAYLFLGEKMSSIQLLGGGLILAGVVLLRVMEGQNGK